MIERYWDAQDPYDPEGLARCRHPGWSADWPQSGERIPSHDADVAIHSSYPGYPSHSLERLGGSDEVWRALPTQPLFTPVRMSGASDYWIGEARLEYPDSDVWCAVVALDLRDGLVAHETAYWCRVSDSPPWAATYPDRTPSPLPAISVSMEHDAGAEGRHEATVRSYADLAASDPGAAAEAMFHGSAVIDRPQYGQRVSGLAGIALAHDEQRAVLPGRLGRAVASGHLLVTESRLDHAGAAWLLVSILEFQGDKVARATEYLAESYDPPEWRRPWVEWTPVGG